MQSKPGFRYRSMEQKKVDNKAKDAGKVETLKKV